jgi:glycosyltransferase involved in cell wall biosynthesis
VLAELRGFRQLGCPIWLVAPPESQIYQRAEKEGISVLSQRFDQRLFLPFYILRMALWLRKKRIEIVNPHSSRDAWLMTIAARVARVPLIIRSRHFDVPIPNKSVSRLMYKEWSHHIITTSPIITETLRKTFEMGEEDVTTLPTGVDLERFRPDGPRAELSVPKGVPLIGMITVLRYAKGVQILAEAVKILRDQGLRVHAVIVGEGPVRSFLEETLTKLGITDQFTLLGHREDVPELIRTLDIVAIPSFHEAIPQSGLQALASGVPVVASNVGGIPSVIQDGATGTLVPPKDPAALANAIRSTLADTEGAQKKVQAGRRLIEDEYSLAKMMEKLQRLYQRHLQEV